MTTIVANVVATEMDGVDLVVALDSVDGIVEGLDQGRGGEEGSSTGFMKAQLKFMLSVLKIARSAIIFHSIWKQMEGSS